MLNYLFEVLAQDISFFNVFRYLTLRGILGVITALSICLVIGPAMIRWLSHYQIGQTVRDDGPETHLKKAGTPTMGGALILVSITVSTLLWADLGNRFVWVVLLTTLMFGVIGWVDDYKKLVNKDPRGIGARNKYFWQTVFGLVAAACSAVLHIAKFGRNSIDRSVLQKCGGGFGNIFYSLQLSGYCRFQQCR